MRSSTTGIYLAFAGACGTSPNLHLLVHRAEARLLQKCNYPQSRHVADESKRDEVVATALYAKVMEYATDLLSLEGVSDKHRELATRKLADGFNEMVAQDRMWETDEGKQKLQGVQNRLRALIDKHKSEGAPAWGESVRDAPLCSHPTFANKR